MNELIKKPLSANMGTELLVPSREQNGMIEWAKRCALGGIGQFYADKSHTRISYEYTTIKRWLRGLFSHAHTRDISRIQR